MTLHNDKDFEDLFFEAKAGNKDAESRLFSYLHASYLSLAKRRIGEVQEAEDVVQATMETIVKKYQTADLVKGFLPWANQILFYKIGNYYRAQGRIRKHEGPEGERKIEGREVPEQDIVQNERETSMILHKAIARLSDECRKIFALLLSEQSREDIQRAFGGIPMGTIDSKIHRCRKKLKSLLIRDFGWEV